MPSVVVTAISWQTIDLGDGGSHVSWSGLQAAIRFSDNAYVSAAAGAFATFKTHGLDVTPSSLATIPVGSNILGIQVRIERKATGTVTEILGQLRKSGIGMVGTNKISSTSVPSSDTYRTLGGASDLWGTTWTRDEIVNNLRFVYQCDGLFSVDEVFVDHVEFTITYSLPISFAANLSGEFGGDVLVAAHLKFAAVLAGEFSGNVEMGGAVVLYGADLQGSFGGDIVLAGALISLGANLQGSFDGNISMGGGFAVAIKERLPKIRVQTLVRFYND